MKNIFLMLLTLSCTLGYILYGYIIENNLTIDKQPFVFWAGLDPHTELYVEWETSEKTGTFIEYGLNSFNFSYSFYNSTKTTLHKVKLSNLTADTRYYYRVKASPTSSTYLSDIRTFKTAPLESNNSEEFNFTCISDTQELLGIGFYNTLARAIKKSGDTDFLVNAGDLTQVAEDQNLWNYYFYESCYLDRIPLVPCPGNHDSIDNHDSKYIKYFGITANERDTFYAFNWSNAQIIVAQIADRAHVDPSNPRNFANFQWL
ncbi:MAG: fibronectin type III domain-containing protein, partial [Promethearchaeota archaeon]